MGFFDHFWERKGLFTPNKTRDIGDNTEPMTNDFATKGLTPLQMEQNRRTGVRPNWQTGEKGVYVSPRIMKSSDAVPTGERKG